MVLEENLSDSRAPKINYAANTRPLRVGDKGVAYGDIKPHGRAIINDLTYSVESTGEFISDNREIIIVEEKNYNLYGIFNINKVSNLHPVCIRWVLTFK